MHTEQKRRHEVNLLEGPKLHVESRVDETGLIWLFRKSIDADLDILAGNGITHNDAKKAIYARIKS